MPIYPSIYQAKAVSVSTTGLTAFIPQVFGDVSVNITDIIGTPAAGMGWVFFQAGNSDFPVWLGATATTTDGGGGGTTPEAMMMPSQIWNWAGMGDELSLEEGQVATDLAPRDATELYVSKVDDAMSVDWSYQMDHLVPGDYIYLQYAPDSASWHRYALTDVPSREGDVWCFHVTTDGGSAPGTGPPVGSPILISFEEVASAPGPPGPPGTSGGSYTHYQSVPAAVWTITHNLGYHPSITVMDSAGDAVEGDVSYDDDNTVTLTFTGAFSGSAYLS